MEEQRDGRLENGDVGLPQGTHPRHGQLQRPLLGVPGFRPKYETRLTPGKPSQSVGDVEEERTYTCS